MITVSNAAESGPTSGLVTMNETVPLGMTLVSMTGTGWTCPNGGTTCTRRDALAAGGSYLPITALVNVAPYATSPQVNAVSVTGGGSVTANTTDSTGIISTSKPGFDSNADGKFDVLWQLPTTGDLGVWFMNGTAQTGAAGISGPTDWRVPGAADFNGDGKPDILWQHAISGDLWVWLMKALPK